MQIDRPGIAISFRFRTMVPSSQSDIASFRRDGAVVVRGAFASWVNEIAAGIARNMDAPGPFALESAVPEGEGCFFDDYNWMRIPEFGRVVRESAAAYLAADAMQSACAQFFHDHVLVMESGTSKPTLWHQDAPYYFVDGSQTVSMWIAVDPVRDASLRLIAGSHLWPSMVRPVSWADNEEAAAGSQVVGASGRLLGAWSQWKCSTFPRAHRQIP